MVPVVPFYKGLVSLRWTVSEYCMSWVLTSIDVTKVVNRAFLLQYERVMRSVLKCCLSRARMPLYVTIVVGRPFVLRKGGVYPGTARARR
jgi:hypothetical protein